MASSPIRNGTTKAMLVIAGYAVAILVGFMVELSTRSGWGVVASSTVVLLVVLVLSRLFRGEHESDTPRRWWRMTAYPAAGFVLTGWFLLQAISAMAAAAVLAGPAGWSSGTVSLVLAIAYANSAIRLTAIDRARRSVRA